MVQQQLKILVIEDEPVFRTTLVAQLRQGGNLVYEAANGVEGLAAVTLYQPDLVLCDLQMPMMDGHQVIACINRRYPHIPIMVVSGQDNMQDVSRALRGGACDYVIKPIRNWSEFHQVLQACLSNEVEAAARRELDQHLHFFAQDDVAASHLLTAMSPPRQQSLGAWQASYDSDSPLLIPEFFLIGERLLLVVSELSVLDADATFMGAMMKCLLSGPYRQFQQGESQLLGAPGRVLEYLNWHLCESGLQGTLNAAVLLFNVKEQSLLYANAGLGSPHWLQQAEGLPLGLVKQSDYSTHQRGWRLPWEMAIKGEGGATLTIRLGQE